MTEEIGAALPGTHAESATSPATGPGRVPHEARPATAMVIVAHPDDADFGAAATLARWCRDGTRAWLVCCTSGDAGADDPRTDPLELARRREEEQRAAARVVGYEEVFFLHRPDGALENDLALREQLVRVIRQLRPEAVLTMDPTVLIQDNSYIQHVDHRQAGLAALDAVYPAARNAMAFPHLAIDDGLEPHSVRWVYLFFSDQPTAWVDVSDTLDAKIAALRCHVSQLRRPEELEEMIRSWAAESGEQVGRAAAETFRVVEIG